MTGQAMESNTNGESTQSSLGSTPSTTTNGSENGAHSPPMAPKDLEPSIEEVEGNKLKDPTVDDLSNSLIQITKDADLDYY